MKPPEQTVFSSGRAIQDYDPEWEFMRAGEVRAFENLFRKYYPVLLAYGSKLAPAEEAKDEIQSLFLQIWERRQFLGPTTSAKNYLLASLRRRLHKRAETGLQSTFQPDLDFRVELSAESQIIASQTSDESFNLLAKAFEHLPARQKEAIYLRFYNNLEFNEISAIMGISVRATYKLIYKGLNSLQGQFEEKKINLAQLLTLIFLISQGL